MTGITTLHGIGEAVLTPLRAATEDAARIVRATDPATAGSTRRIADNLHDAITSAIAGNDGAIAATLLEPAMHAAQTSGFHSGLVRSGTFDAHAGQAMAQARQTASRLSSALDDIGRTHDVTPLREILPTTRF